jgi:hypothetical protein
MTTATATPSYTIVSAGDEFIIRVEGNDSVSVTSDGFLADSRGITRYFRTRSSARKATFRLRTGRSR